MSDDLIPHPQPRLLAADDWRDYALLDSGNGQKLERFGGFTFVRPEPQALWAPRRKDADWQAADGRFVASQGRGDDDDDAGGWTLSRDLPAHWSVSYDGLQFLARPTPFRHLGFFPEQAPHWNWCAGLIDDFISRHGRAPRILNLFAYSGVASLHAARAGAEVAHVDASRKAIAQAFENRDEAGLGDAPIRFITEDAGRFVEREIRRGRSYDGILLDPPKYGRGPKGERWHIETDLVPLLRGCRGLLSDTPLFLLLTIYAIRASSQAAHYALADLMAGSGGQISSGELVSVEAGDDPRLVSQANFARWQATG
ncbi:MAG: class I SAM-dependent methyltransferase [Pseudomonadota bacterium]|nr:class I SAM-dependent methyltransferase [Pseudomonadota bacterium]